MVLDEVCDLVGMRRDGKLGVEGDDSPPGSSPSSRESGMAYSVYVRGLTLSDGLVLATVSSVKP